MADSTSAYESWVVGLRAWQLDPAHDLSGLPSLSVDSFTPATYARLMNHVNTAISEMMTAWSQMLQRALSTAVTDHDRARELAQLRVRLARRLQLARHPGWPTEISEALWKGAVGDIRALQADLEKSASGGGEYRGSSARGESERTLAIVRSTRFTAIIEPGFDLESLFSDRHPSDFAAPLAGTLGPPPSDTVPLTTSTTRRRIVVD